MIPLAGRTILVTRSHGQAGGLTTRLEQLGASVLECPVIDFAEPADWSPVDRAIGRLAAYSLIIFTSANAVDRFLGRIQKVTGSPACLRPARIVAIGPATSRRLEESGAAVDAVAASFRAEGLLELISAGGSIEGMKILLPRAETAREILPESLRKMGAELDVVTVYRTVALPVPAAVREALASGRVDLVTFTSSSTVTNLIDGLGGPGGLGAAATAVIGPVTAETLRGKGIEPDIVAEEAGMHGLAEAIAQYFGGAAS